MMRLLLQKQELRTISFVMAVVDVSAIDAAV